MKEFGFTIRIAAASWARSDFSSALVCGMCYLGEPGRPNQAEQNASHGVGAGGMTLSGHSRRDWWFDGSRVIAICLLLSTLPSTNHQSTASGKGPQGAQEETLEPGHPPGPHQAN